MREQPLPQANAHLSFDGCGVGPWLDAANQVQPMVVHCVQIALQQWFGVQWQKEIGRIVAQSIAKERRRSDSHHGKWYVIQVEDAADDGRIGCIPYLP